MPAPETAKERQSGGIEHQHGAAQPVDDSIPKERNQPGKDGNGDISPVADSRRGNRSTHHIARDPTRIASGKGPDQNTLCELRFRLPVSRVEPRGDLYRLATRGTICADRWLPRHILPERARRAASDRIGAPH
jgi:hypothetical protein